MTWSEQYVPSKADIIEAIRGIGVQTPQAQARREELFEIWLENQEVMAAVVVDAQWEDKLAEAEAEIVYWKDQFERAVAKLDRTYQGYEFTAGRSGSPRELKRLQGLLEERFGKKEQNGSE